MRYNQPYGLPDEVVPFDHPYVNGDPSIARQGSIPPAESIEYPQREIIKVIQWAYDHGYVDQDGNPCLQPTNVYLDQLLKALFGIINAKNLRGPTTVYVNGSTGSDTLYDGSQPTVDGSKGPFATIDRALVEMAKYNLAGFNYFIRVADGLYTKNGPIILPLPNGSGSVHLIGNDVTPTNCVLLNSGSGSVLRELAGGNYVVSGFSLSNTAVAAGDSNSLIDTQAGSMTVGNINCGASVGSHLTGWINGYMFILGPNISISGGCPSGSHILALEGGRALTHVLATPVVNVTVTAPITVASFARSEQLSYCRPIYLSLSGAANVTGSKYAVSANAVMNTQGRGVSYLPGTVAGTAVTGGQYQ